MTSLLTIVVGLFAIVNPFGAVPVFVSLTKNDSNSWKRSQAMKGSIGMVIILIIFYILGTHLLNFFGISLSGIRVAGGIIILKYGYDLFNSVKKEEVSTSLKNKDISFSPLAMPMLSGPGSIAFVIGLAAQEGRIHFFLSIIGIIGVGILTFVLLAISPKIVKYLGSEGMDKVSKISGFLTMSVGVQMILSGLKDFF